MALNNGDLCRRVRSYSECIMLNVVIPVPLHSSCYLAENLSDVCGSHHTVFRLSAENADSGLLIIHFQSQIPSYNRVAPKYG